MDPEYKISNDGFLSLLEKLSGRAEVYVPYRKGEQLSLERFRRESKEAMEFGRIRQSEPIKSFLTNPRKELAETPTAGKIIVAGLKACDLASLRLQDFVFAQGDVTDPFYTANRGNLTIFSFDCTEAKETCFCAAMDGQSYPVKDFDLNFSIVDDGYMVQLGSEKGRSILAEFGQFFGEAGREDLDARNHARKRVLEQVRAFIRRRGTPEAARLGGAVMNNYGSAIWKDFYATCVECGACNLACPTCHCFLLFDEKKKGRSTRFMEWDACLYSRFARVAGGGNQRKHLWERLRNRFEKKFDFFPKTAGFYACTGCGRCIDACPGDIDIREVLKGLVNGTWNNPPND